MTYYRSKGAVTGTVFMDNNDNARHDRGDMRLEDVTVRLLNKSGHEIATTTTDAHGNYTFFGVTPGRYKIDFPTELPGKELVTEDARGSNGRNDSDANVNSGESHLFYVGGGRIVRDVDAGFKPAAVEPPVFIECDDPNAVKIDFESADRGDVITSLGDFVTVSAHSRTGEAMVFDTDNPTGGDDDLGGTGQGNVLIISEDGDSSDPDDDADGGTFKFEFKSEVDVFDLKVVDTEEGGVVRFYDDTGTFIKSVALPRVADGTVQQVILEAEGVARMEVELFGSGAIDDICYVPPVLGSLSGRYFEDTNRNGIDDDGNNGIGGVTVALLDENGNPTGATTTTAADGSYSFGDLAAGDYGVKFTDTVSGQTLISANVGGDDAIDSDATDVGGNMSVIDSITVVAGEDTPDNDAGVETVPAPKGSIAGRVWMDNNDNSLEDDGEMGIAGTLVLLRNLDDRTTTRVLTDADGNYFFGDLEEGNYAVRFRSVDGKEFVEGNVGTDDTVDSDNVRTFNNGTATTGRIELAQGEDITDVDVGVETVNTAPTAGDDEAITCANDPVMIDVLANDTDADGDTLTITQVDGQDLGEGDSVTTASGVEVTLLEGKLVINGADAFEALEIGETASEAITYTITDGAATVQATAEVTFKGAAEDFDDLTASLPANGKYQIAADNEELPIGDAAYDMFLDGTGDIRFDGKVFEQAYCLTFRDPVDTAETFDDAPVLMGDITGGSNGDVLDGQISFATGTPGAENMDLVNYVLNQNYEAQDQYNGWEVQLAIWELVDNVDSRAVLNFEPTYGDQADIDAIVADALANGEGFEAGAGDIASFIVDPNPVTDLNSQPFIVAINFDDYDCLC